MSMLHATRRSSGVGCRPVPPGSASPSSRELARNPGATFGLSLRVISTCLVQLPAAERCGFEPAGGGPRAWEEKDVCCGRELGNTNGHAAMGRLVGWACVCICVGGTSFSSATWKGPRFLSFALALCWQGEAQHLSLHCCSLPGGGWQGLGTGASPPLLLLGGFRGSSQAGKSLAG